MQSPQKKKRFEFILRNKPFQQFYKHQTYRNTFSRLRFSFFFIQNVFSIKLHCSLDGRKL